MNSTQQIALPETFSFDQYEWFNNECTEAIRYNRKVELLCDKVQFLDSAALGMIASLHKKIEKPSHRKVVVKNPSAYCDDLFILANMYEHYLDKAKV